MDKIIKPVIREFLENKSSALLSVLATGGLLGAISFFGQGINQGFDNIRVQGVVAPIIIGSVLGAVIFYFVVRNRELRETQNRLLSEQLKTEQENSSKLLKENSDRKQTEAQLRASEERFRTLSQIVPVGIFETDADGRYVHVNKHWCNIAGLAAHDALGDGWSKAIHPEDRERVFNEWNLAATERKPFSMQYRFRGPDGRVTHVIGQAAEKTDLNQNVTGYVGSITDITTHKELEEQLLQAQKMEAVGQLTGGVAHDFNNLLAVIQGNAEFLADQLGTDDAMAQAILRASTRGAELTQRLLAFSRRQPLRPKVIDLTQLVEDMRDLLIRTLGAPIEVKILSSADLSPTLADPGQVENVLLNLAINARDAMPDSGALTIECTNARIDDEYVADNPEAMAGDYVVLAVSDTGTGMSKEVIEHAFEPFFTTKDVGQGSGLGLSMIYGFAKQSGGHVAIYSEVGRGTTVKLYLPRAGQAKPADGSDDGDELPRGQGERLLVIEDDSDVRALTVRTLEELNYRVTDVDTAVAARECLADGEEIDLILSDVVLPGGISGPDFVEAALVFNPRFKVVFMSGYPAAAARRNGLLSSSHTLLTKPFERASLAAAVREALDD